MTAITSPLLSVDSEVAKLESEQKASRVSLEPVVVTLAGTMVA